MKRLAPARRGRRPSLPAAALAYACVFFVLTLAAQVKMLALLDRRSVPSAGGGRNNRLEPGTRGRASEWTVGSKEWREETEMERRSRHHPDTVFPPFLLWTAARASSVTDDERQYRKGCRRTNPKYKAYVYDDRAAGDFVHRHFPEFASLYDGFDRPVMRADVWRYLVLYQYEGIYLDLDVECVKPVEEWFDGLVDHSSLGRWGSAPKKPKEPPRALLGIEFRDESSPVFQVTQWTMAAEPGFRVFYRAVELIRDTVRELGLSGPIADGRVPEVTGPTVVTRAVLEYLVEQGCLSAEQVSHASFPNHPQAEVRDLGYRCLDASRDVVVGELGLLHKNAFGHNWNPPPEGGRGYGGSNIFVQHHFSGRWRKET